MKRHALWVGLAGLTFFLAGCPQTPTPVDPVQCPVGPLQVQTLEDRPIRLQGLGAFQGEYVPGEVLVLPGPGLRLQALEAQGLKALDRTPLGQTELLRLRVPPGEEEAWARRLLAQGAAYVQPNYIYRPLRVPNDPMYPTDQKVYMDLVGLEAAWDRSTGRGCPPTVAVLDTGYLDHPDMQGVFLLGWGVKLDVADGYMDPKDRLPPDHRGHGLAVAGVYGAQTNNGRGMAGVAWGGRVVPIKVFKDDGTATTQTVLEGVRLARGLGVQIISMSLGGSGGDGLLANELSQAYAQGIFLVAAAGNDGGSVLFPASHPAVVAVGAVDRFRIRASFSNRGPELELVAPGVQVLAPAPSGGFATVSGTSFASPMVAGAAALYMSRYGSLNQAWPSPDQVRTCLTATAEDLGPTGRDDEYGYGLVRADRVLTDTTYCFP